MDLLPAGTHPGLVRLQVSDLRRSTDYYEGVIGLRVRYTAQDAALLLSHGLERPLVELHARAGVRPVPSHGAYGLHHFALLVPDRAALGRFAAHLARRGVRFAAADHRVSEALYLWDPDGLGIEVYADRPRERWQYVGGQLVMTTERLDLADLVATGSAAPWDGMPAGTMMGHLHLHVGSLDAAEAFYHRALGLDRTVWTYPGALFFAAGGYHHHLGTNTWSPGPAAAPDQARLLDWTLVVPDPDAAAAAARRLRAAGFTVDAGDASESWIAVDPWGTCVRLTSRPDPA